MLRHSIFSVFFLGVAFSQPNIPKLEQRVSDFTNTLSYVEWNSLEQQLKTFVQQSSAVR